MPLFSEQERKRMLKEQQKATGIKTTKTAITSSQEQPKDWSNLFANLPIQSQLIGQLLGSINKSPLGGPVIASGISGFGKALPEVMKREEMAFRGQTPSYGEQLRTVGGDIGEFGGYAAKQAGLNMLLNPLRTLTGLRGLLAQQQIATQPVATALQQTKLPLGTGGAGTTRAIEEGVTQFGGGRVAQARDLFGELSELERISRKAKGIKETGKALVQQQAAGGLRTLLRQQAPAAATISKLMQPFIKAQQATGFIKRAIPYALGTGAVGALMKALGVF